MKNKIRVKNVVVVFVIFVAIICLLPQIFSPKAYADTDNEFEQKLDVQGFPESYRVYLRTLHQEHPNWNFTAKQLDYTWNDALSAQYKNADVNLIPTISPDAFKAVKSGTYNFNTHSYIGKDSSSWVAASKAAVAYYMDPRNWLTNEYVFQFESLKYNPEYQTSSIVSKILSDTAMPAEATAYYMAAANQNLNFYDYSISPVYLAAKSRVELGKSNFMINGHSFTYSGKTYSGYYNAYNIGATDSADGSAALKGLVYAAGGSDGNGTTYQRPWNSLEKAVKGGAIWIADGYINNNQYTLYTERFNVYNGLSNIATHQYATAVTSASTQASVMSENYENFGVLDESFDFEIPVYKDIPSSICAKPPTTGNNNCYLDSFTVTSGDTNYSFTPDFNRFTSTYTLQEILPGEVSKLSIDANKNDSGSQVTISGDTGLKDGSNKITIKCKSSSGLVSKYYYLNVTRDKSTEYIPNTPSKLQVKNIGGKNVKLTWTGDSKATGYRIGYKRASGNTWYYIDTDKTEYTKKMVTGDIVYDYKVKAYSESNGVKTYSEKYSDIVRCASFTEDEITLSGSLSGGYMTIVLNWNKIGKVDGYSVYYRQKNTKEWESDNVNNAVFKAKMARAGKGYEFKVIPYISFDGQKFHSGTESAVKTIYTLKKTTVSLEKKYKQSIKVCWTNISGETGYEIYRSTEADGGFKRVIKASNKYASWFNSGLTLGKTYYYKIRAYRNTAPGIYVYGPFSNVAELNLK